MKSKRAAVRYGSLFFKVQVFNMGLLFRLLLSFRGAVVCLHLNARAILVATNFHGVQREC